VSVYRHLPALGLLLAGCLVFGTAAGAQQREWQATFPPDDPSLALPHELEEQRLLDSPGDDGLNDERAAELAAEEEAIQEDIRQFEAGLQDAAAQTGVLPLVAAGGSRTASVRVHASTEDLKQWEAVLRHELVPTLRSLGASDAEIEIMVRDLARILSGAEPDQ
jgi:hypothetical protein